MKPSGTLRHSCRGLRCPAVTPAHWFGWRGHNAVWPKASVGIKGRMPPQPFVFLGGTLLQRRGLFRSVPSIMGRRVRQRANAQPHLLAPQPSRVINRPALIPLTQLTASISAT
jgi:hypothetical protein